MNEGCYFALLANQNLILIVEKISENVLPVFAVLRRHLLQINASCTTKEHKSLTCTCS